MGILTKVMIGILVALAAVLVVLLMYSALTPYEPYDVKKYEVVPDVQCMGDVVQLYPTRVLDVGMYRIIVDPYWVSVFDGKIVESPTSTSMVVEGEGSAEREASQLLQEVPEKAGVWEHHVDITVTGRVGILPRTQTMHKKAATLVTVLPNTDSRCEGRTAIP